MLARFDRKRQKTTSKRDWEHPHDPEVRVAKMKDGRTRLAHKAEQAVALESGALVAVTLQPADSGDTKTLATTVEAATSELEEVNRTGEKPATKAPPNREQKREVVADRGYHSNETVTHLKRAGIRTYISEPDRGRRRWRGQTEVREAV